MFDEEMLKDAIDRMIALDKDRIESVSMSQETFDMLSEPGFYHSKDPGIKTTLIGIEIRIDERLRKAKGLARIEYKYREPQYIFFKGDK